MKIDWKSKLTSRKFWAALIAVIMALLTAFGVDELTSEQVEVLTWAIATLIAYILGEGLVDAAGSKKKEE